MARKTLLLEPTKARPGYRVSNDEQNWILERGKVILKSSRPENVGKTKWQTIGYYQRVSSLFRAYFERVAWDSDKDLPEALQEALMEVDKLMERVNRRFTLGIELEI